jgi:hypothetical protein
MKQKGQIKPASSYGFRGSPKFWPITKWDTPRAPEPKVFNEEAQQWQKRSTNT